MKEADTNKKRRHILRRLLILGVIYCALRHAMAKRAGGCQECMDDLQDKSYDFRASYLKE